MHSTRSRKKAKPSPPLPQKTFSEVYRERGLACSEAESKFTPQINELKLSLQKGLRDIELRMLTLQEEEDVLKKAHWDRMLLLDKLIEKEREKVISLFKEKYPLFFT